MRVHAALDRARPSLRRVRRQVADRVGGRIGGRWAATGDGPVEYVPITSDGRTFICAIRASESDSYTNWVRSGASEEAPVVWAKRLVGPDSIVIDLGANVGVFSFAVATHCSEVIAVEASPRSALLLTLGAAANADLTVRPVHAAATAARGAVSIHGESAWAQVRDSSGGLTPGLPTRDIERLFASRPADLIKVDIEGGEERVVPDIVAMASDRDRFVMIYEANQSVAARDLRFLHEQVVDAGFQLWYLDPLTLEAGRVDLSVPQYTLNCDVLAVKGAPTVELPTQTFPEDFIVNRLAQELTHESPLHRAYAHAIVDRFPVAGHDRVAEAVRRGRADLDAQQLERFAELTDSFAPEA